LPVSEVYFSERRYMDGRPWVLSQVNANVFLHERGHQGLVRHVAAAIISEPQGFAVAQELPDYYFDLLAQLPQVVKAGTKQRRVQALAAFFTFLGHARRMVVKKEGRKAMTFTQPLQKAPDKHFGPSFKRATHPVTIYFSLQLILL
jgi:hypothetical protein